MPYTDWNYTNPGWTNNNPPAINESNLNDISDTLEKFYFYWWERGVMNHQDVIMSNSDNIQVNSINESPNYLVDIYRTVSYDTQTKKYIYSDSVRITVQNGSSLSNYSGYYVPRVNDDGSYCNKINNTSSVRTSGGVVIFDDTTEIASYNYFTKTDVICSKTKDYPDYGQQDEYFYRLLGVPSENTLKPTIISYLGNGTDNIQIDIGQPFKAVVWANSENTPSTYSVGSLPMIIHQVNQLVMANNSSKYTIDGTVVNITGATNINAAGRPYYLMVI